jgi:antitoxin YefM
MPRITTYSDARAHLKAYCDEVAESGEPLIIKRRSGADVALVSLEELVGLEETAHLLRSPKSARRLFESLEEVRSGGGEALTVEDLQKKLGLDE